MNQNTKCIFDTDGDGDCHRCVRRGGCKAIGGPFEEKIKLETECPAELFGGFFGIDPSGNQPDCSELIVMEVTLDEVEVVDDETYRLIYSISCPKCGTTLDPSLQSWWKARD